jgi:hypothetical protein
VQFTTSLGASLQISWEYRFLELLSNGEIRGLGPQCVGSVVRWGHGGPRAVRTMGAAALHRRARARAH